MNKYLKLLIAILICEGIGFISTPFTISSISIWYAYLNKPIFSPPNWLFAPVWTTLYFLMGVSLYLIWIKKLKSKKIKIAISLFAFQLFLNFLWSILFFGLRSPLLAFFDIVLLWIAILVTMLNFKKISKTAFYLLVPYILWVSFASILNLSIVILNP